MARRSDPTPSVAARFQGFEKYGGLPWFDFGAGPPGSAFNSASKRVLPKSAARRASVRSVEGSRKYFLHHFPQLCQQLVEERTEWRTEQLAPLRRQVERFLRTAEEWCPPALDRANAVQQPALRQPFSDWAEKIRSASGQQKIEARRQYCEALFVEVYRIVVSLIDKGLPVSTAPVQVLLGTGFVKRRLLIQQAIDWAMAQWMNREPL